MKTVKIRNWDMAWDIAADVRFPPAFDENKRSRVRLGKRLVSPRGSFKVNLSTGRWSDFATGDAGGDLEEKQS